MKRVVRAVSLSIGLASVVHSVVAAEVDPLAPTAYIDATHPSIVARARELAAANADPRETAVRIHDWVRDTIPFGFARAFYDQKASEVLLERKGFCNTKSTLFVALLRAAGIPARVHFVSLRADVLEGLLDPGTDYVDHSFAEVFLGGRWLRTDSYIVDRALFEAATARLRTSGKPFGLGIARRGTTMWDGRSDAFSQFVSDQETPKTSTMDWGIHADVGAFYASATGTFNGGPFARVMVWLTAGSINARVEALRSEVPTPP